MGFTRRHVLAGTAGLAVLGQAIAREALGKPMSEDSILELRQYTLRGGQRDTLISIFEKNFIEPQNVLGAHVLGEGFLWTDLVSYAAGASAAFALDPGIQLLRQRNRD